MPIPEKKTPNRYLSAKERVYGTLRDWIVDGTLGPGEKLLDSEISHYFDVSRTPVREALQLLAEQKLVEVVPSSGTRVSQINRDDLSRLYEAISGINCLALDMVFPRLTPEHLAQLEDINEALEAAVGAGRPAQAAGLDCAFHQFFLARTQNPYLIDCFSALMLHAQRAENLFFKANDNRFSAYASHRKILSCIRAGDLAQARAELAANWARSI